VHAAHDDELADAVMTDLAVVEMRRNDTGDATAGEPSGIGEAAHEPDPTAAIDQLDAAFGQASAELDGSLAVYGVGSVGGAAINAQALHCRHVLLPVVVEGVIIGKVLD
jgi:hypothetical protein